MLKNKKILFIVEKPSQANTIKYLDEFKNLSLNNEINFHYAHCTVSYYSYKYPNNLKYKDLPFIGDLSFKLNVEAYNSKYPLEWSFPMTASPYYLASNNLNKEFFLHYDTIIFATDQDGSGCYGAYLELEQVLGTNFENLIESIYFISTNIMFEKTMNEEIFNVLNNLEFKNKRVNEFYEFVNEGKIKKYFDYNYQFNSNVFIKEVYKCLFLNDFKDNKEFEETYTNSGFTKYMLLTMLSYFKYIEINKKEYFNAAELHNYLSHYIGTGKYKNEYFIGLGSPASRDQIIKNLISLKIIKNKHIFSENKKYVYERYIFDKKVKNIIMLLNKKLYDPDLPFRVEEWQSLEFKEAKEKIDNYIKSVFIKQKIKNKFLIK